MPRRLRCFHQCLQPTCTLNGAALAMQLRATSPKLRGPLHCQPAESVTPKCCNSSTHTSCLFSILANILQPVSCDKLDSSRNGVARGRQSSSLRINTASGVGCLASWVLLSVAVAMNHPDHPAATRFDLFSITCCRRLIVRRDSSTLSHSSPLCRFIVGNGKSQSSK